MYETVKGAYGDCLVWRERPEPVRPDPKADEITRAEYLRETGWTVETLDYAISAHNHPRSVAFRPKGRYEREPVYLRSKNAVWRERFTADLRRLGFVK